jgi:2-methylcitrate dehydratase PrpD
MNKSLTEMLGSFIVTEAQALITPNVRHQAIRAILDTLAVTIAGGSDPAVQCLESALDPVPSAPTRSFWSGRTYLPSDAALLYGMASHMYDYDDVSMVAVCHPSAPVLSALIAAQAGRLAPPDSSGLDFVTAFAIGTEVMIRIGQAMGFRHYELGFHSTSTLGTIGATAAVARLLRLDETQTCNALAISASAACGLRKNFGSMVKPLHVGLAASSAVRAVRMAQAGMQGASEVFESSGFLQAFSGGMTDQFPSKDIALGQLFALEEPGFEQKRYPCCYMLHKMIEATLQLRLEYGCMLSEVERVHVHVPAGGTKPLIHPFAKSGLNGKFSAPYAITASLTDGRIDFSSFTDAAVLRPELQDRFRDVLVSEDGSQMASGSDIGRYPVTVRLFMKDGREFEKTIVVSPGSMEDPLTLPQLKKKWVDCLVHGVPTLGQEAAGDYFDESLSLDQEPNTASWLERVLGASPMFTNASR